MEKTKKRETKPKKVLTPVTLKQVRGGVTEDPATTDFKSKMGHKLP